MIEIKNLTKIYKLSSGQMKKLKTKIIFHLRLSRERY